LEEVKNFKVQQDVTPRGIRSKASNYCQRRRNSNSKATVSLLKTWGTSGFSMEEIVVRDS